MPSGDAGASLSAPDMPSGDVDASVSVPDVPSVDVKAPKKKLFGKFLKKKSSKASVEVRLPPYSASVFANFFFCRWNSFDWSTCHGLLHSIYQVDDYTHLCCSLSFFFGAPQEICTVCVPSVHTFFFHKVPTVWYSVLYSTSLSCIPLSCWNRPIDLCQINRRCRMPVSRCPTSARLCPRYLGTFRRRLRAAWTLTLPCPRWAWTFLPRPAPSTCPVSDARLKWGWLS